MIELITNKLYRYVGKKGNETNFFFISFLLYFQIPTRPLSFGDEHFNNDLYNNYLEAGELILEINKIDINNRSLYEGYFLNFINDCQAEVKLKPYSSKINTIRVDICKKILLN